MPVKKASLLSCLCFGSILIACDGDDGSDDGGEALSADATVADAFLSAGHFQVVGDPPALEAEDARRKVDRQGIFRNHSNAPEAAATTAPPNACAVVQDEVVVDGRSITVRYRSDSGLCPKKAGATLSATLKMKVFAKVTCSDTDLTPYKAMTAAMLVERDVWHFCQNDPTEEIVVNVSMHASFTSKDASMVTTAYGGLMSRDFGPCQITMEGGRRAVDGCSMRMVSARDGKHHAYELFELDDASGEAAAVFFDTGSAAVVMNDWQGTVTFSTTSNPTYELTNGVDTVNGTIGGGSADETEAMELSPRPAVGTWTSGIVGRFVP